MLSVHTGDLLINLVTPVRSHVLPEADIQCQEQSLDDQSAIKQLYNLETELVKHHPVYPDWFLII